MEIDDFLKAETLTIDTELLTRGRNVRAKTTNAG